AQVVEADMNDRTSLENAFSGAYGAFCVTNFWETFSPEGEKAQARNLAEAAKTAGVQHVIWSTLEDTRRWVPLEDDRMPTLMENYKVPHFDGKGEADAIFEEVGVPTTNLLTAFYYDNLITFGMGPQRGEDGTLAFNMPMGEKKMPSIAVADIGRAAYGIFKAGEEYIGKTVGIAGEHLTGQEMAAAMSSAFGEPVSYNAVPFDVYRGLGFPGADDLGNMFQFKHDFEDYFCGARPVDATRDLNPRLESFQSWLDSNKDKIPLDPA
ncbi:MAG: NmrA/HSCARG family protein, partial [Gemmatimonadetes bacterium]|nr:NmrA/HSCARG family protein [Gemmatimonadota bacterium]